MAGRLFTEARTARLKSLMAAGESGAIRCTGSANYFLTFVRPLPAGTITPGSTLRFGSHLNKYSPFNGGHALKVTIAQGANEVLISQSSIGASLAFFNWDAKLTLGADRKFGYIDNVNVLNVQGASVAAGTFPSFIAKTGGAANLSARTRSGQVAFVSYSAPPTVETRLIDFDQACEIRFYVSAAAGDTVEMKSAFIELLSGGSAFVDYCNPKATLFFGHSLVEGSGATSGSDIVNLLRAARPGRPFDNLGLGGQKYVAGSMSFADRILADPRAKTRDMIIWGPENDATGDGPGWANIILTRLAEIMAYRAAGTKTIICNSVTSSDWSAGIISAAQYVNAQLAASPWSALIADMYTPICTQPDGKPNPAYQADAIHHNDAGYAVDKTTIDTKMTALGWT